MWIQVLRKSGAEVTEQRKRTPRSRRKKNSFTMREKGCVQKKKREEGEMWPACKEKEKSSTAGQEEKKKDQSLVNTGSCFSS